MEDRTLPSTLTVISADDPAGALVAGTLRYEINQANQDAIAGKSDTIAFSTTQMGTSTVTLLQALVLDVTGATVTVGTETIDGSGAIVIDGNQNDRVFVVNAGVNAALTGLTIQNGSAGGILPGGGIQNAGTLTVTGDTLKGNAAGAGGAISNTGTLTITGAT
jgi:hypothetical protein